MTLADDNSEQDSAEKEKNDQLFKMHVKNLEHKSQNRFAHRNSVVAEVSYDDGDIKGSQSQSEMKQSEGMENQLRMNQTNSTLQTINMSQMSQLKSG